MDNVVRGANWFFDVLNTWRVLDEVQLPEINFNTEAFSPSGHMMEVTWPEDLAGLEGTIKLKTDDPQVRGLCGRQPGNYITSTYYENLVSFRNGETKGRVIILKGLVNTVRADARKGLKASGTEYVFNSIVLYHDLYDGRSIHKFDFFAGPAETIINGERPFAQMATNLSIGGGTVL
ncbi:phage major tail tube protein [Chelatococcus sp.]|uniref:phage major tail tube protein n=1 Tax=Chelatococcus sp. TaxID=1953771 RepID=UPI001ECF9616|nr:phage major tail tube protein [Chelatococcus sp.]MBX3545604.1 phage major tail tube protein [Chelatococcus sp.]